MNLRQLIASEFVTVEVDLDTSFLQTTWLQQPDSAQFREQLQRVIDYILTHQINKTLFDTRARAYLEIADQNWVIREIFPLFKERAVRFAYLISPMALEALDVFRIQFALETDDSSTKKMQIKLFLYKDEALQWLWQTE
ncbi:hypothetical protein HUW51_19485 [Adhaeribacter swui]|uniref:STAS/SEC14 domain-containing protein n=1 Tax=Adhaeribacter swui TaxID=2086471 RepID=A0A7G7GCB9_9BACT|nr:hypothetical protein [Adhaeribacter swui]QNF34803.1 hypothetical protein HUW51_19485 [Adhaeribacter swui]